MMFKQTYRRMCFDAIKEVYESPELMVDRLEKGLHYSIWRVRQRLLEVFCDTSA